MSDMIADTMCDYDDDKLTEGINEFDRLMATHEACQSTYEAADFVDSHDVTFSVGGAKPDVDVDDAEHGGIELVQLSVPDDQEKSKQLAVWQLIGNKKTI